MEPKKLVGGVLLGVLAVCIIGWASSRSHKTNAPQVGQASPKDKWHVAESRSPMDDSKTVGLGVDAEVEIQGPLGAFRPSLIVRCQEKQTEVYVVTGMAASLEEGIDHHTVEIRLDDGIATEDGWRESSDRKALFAENPFYDMNSHKMITTPEFAKEIAAAKTLTFRFTPFDGNPQVMQFDVRGLDSHLHQLAEACDWAY